MVGSRTHRRRVGVDGGHGDREVHGDSSAWAAIAEMDHTSGLSEVRRYSNRARCGDGLTGLGDLPRLP